jgi:hypothetical protein
MGGSRDAPPLKKCGYDQLIQQFEGDPLVILEAFHWSFCGETSRQFGAVRHGIGRFAGASQTLRGRLTGASPERAGITVAPGR